MASQDGVYTATIQASGPAYLMIVTINCNGHHNANSTSSQYGVVSTTCS